MGKTLTVLLEGWLICAVSLIGCGESPEYSAATAQTASTSGDPAQQDALTARSPASVAQDPAVAARTPAHGKDQPKIEVDEITGIEWATWSRSFKHDDAVPYLAEVSIMVRSDANSPPNRIEIVFDVFSDQFYGSEDWRGYRSAPTPDWRIGNEPGTGFGFLSPGVQWFNLKSGLQATRLVYSYPDLSRRPWWPTDRNWSYSDKYRQHPLWKAADAQRSDVLFRPCDGVVVRDDRWEVVAGLMRAADGFIQQRRAEVGPYKPTQEELALEEQQRQEATRQQQQRQQEEIRQQQRRQDKLRDIASRYVDIGKSVDPFGPRPERQALSTPIERDRAEADQIAWAMARKRIENELLGMIPFSPQPIATLEELTATFEELTAIVMKMRAQQKNPE